MAYDFQQIEKKWQDSWKQNPVANSRPTGNGKKYYCLDMFPYPSGSGLHVGHWRGYVLSDVYARIKWLEGYNVLHPMGWDAFGLPAENDAIKKGIHPKIGTAKNIATFKRQLHAIGAIYDWSKEVNTTDPEFYKWTQWIFIQMFNAGLAYRDKKPINWCPSCLTGLANEEVVNGGCERCGTPVEQKEITQWVLRITNYAQKLLDGLDKLEWSENLKLMQRNWIGRSEGAKVKFSVVDKNIILEVYTTRPDTLFGATFMVMAPEHESLSELVTAEQKNVVDAYVQECALMTQRDRMVGDKEKTGVFTGAYALNPVNNQKVPVYIASYVLRDYGTGVIMAVPAHDERDFAFAKKYDLPIKQVIEGDGVKKDDAGNLLEAYVGDGLLINSDFLNDLDAKTDGIKKVADWLEEQGHGERKINYKLRDWIFSRQRYWGEPIPLIHCDKCGTISVPEDQLPIELPEVENYQPTGTGESPLAAVTDWVNVKCHACGGPAKRETNTMPQWAGSCWYFLRYPNPNLSDKPFDKKDMEYWLPVDLYVGGIEHAILHLLYARFYTKVLYDLGHIPFDEPFSHMFNQGMITKLSEKSGHVEKMSKSKGNVVNPDDIVGKYGSDALRMYIMFMGAPELDSEWQSSGLEGIKRFQHKLWGLLTDTNNHCADGQEDKVVTKRVHRFLKDFQDRIARFKPNTAIAAFMELVNDAIAQKMKFSPQSLELLCATFSVLAPHTASELLEIVLNKKLQDCSWPTYDSQLATVANVTIAIQVNGKMRAQVEVPRGAAQADVQPQAQEAIAKWLDGKQVVKVIFVKDRLMSFVVR